MLKHFLFTICLIGSLFIANTVHAQKFSAIANFQTFGLKKVTGTNLNYEGETSFSINTRFYDKNRWAFRLGAGVDQFKYEIDDTGLGNTNFDVVQQNITANIGLEKHMKILFLYPYVGAYIPVTFNANNLVNDVQEEFSSGKVWAGFGLNGGLNIRLFKIFMLGAEVNMGFDRFKSDVIDNLGDAQNIQWKNLDATTAVTVGVVF